MTFKPLPMIMGLVALCLSVVPFAARAIPAFASQTSLPCQSCHVGGFGPQLTETGRMFKLTGYTMGDKKSFMKQVSGMMFGGSEHTKAALDAPPSGYRGNDNLNVDQVSLFYGGKLSDHVGMLGQVTWSPADKATALDNTDIRYANTGKLFGKGLIYGLTLNSNPSVQDAWQSTPAWRFPYLGSAIAPGPDADPYISALGGRIKGLGGYGLWNDMVFVEYSLYSNLPNWLQGRLGQGGAIEADHLKSTARYWRIALQHNFGPHFLSVGGYGFDARRYPANDRSEGTDHMIDAAMDATWQFTSSEGDHSFSAYASSLREKQNLDATFALGGSENARNHLNQVKANLCYYYKNTYGVTVGYTHTTGSGDAVLYGSPNAKPDSRFMTYQLDYTPTGHDPDKVGHELNLRYYLQYIAYSQFNGTALNYDGTGRNAADNNTTLAGVWLAF